MKSRDVRAKANEDDQASLPLSGGSGQKAPDWKKDAEYNTQQASDRRERFNKQKTTDHPDGSKAMLNIYKMAPFYTGREMVKPTKSHPGSNLIPVTVIKHLYSGVFKVKLDTPIKYRTKVDGKRVTKVMDVIDVDGQKLRSAVEETRLKPNSAARDYMSQMDASHSQIYGGGTQKPPGKLMKAIRKAEAERKRNGDAELEEGYWSQGTYYSFGTSHYLMVPMVDGRKDMSKWAVMPYEDTPGSNPLGLRTQLNKYAKRLGWDHYDVLTQWNGDIDEQITKAEKQAEEYADKRKERPAQYWDGVKTAKALNQAKEVMSTADEVKPEELDEGRDPMDVINKFLKKKEDRAARIADLTRNPHKVNQLKSDEQLDEYKPGVTVLTREISFADLDGTELSSHYNPDEEYATVKKIRWPYGIEVSFHDRSRTVRFRTAKMKTVAKILEKHIDFGATSAAEVLELPQELMMGEASYEAGMDDNSVVIVRGVKGMKSTSFRKKFRNMAEFEKWADSDAAGDYEVHQVTNEADVGDKVKYRNIKSKRNKTGTVRKVDNKNGQKRYELDGGKMVYDQDLEEGGKVQSEPAKAGDGTTGTMYHYGDPNSYRWTIWDDGTVMVHKNLDGYQAQGAEKAKLVKLAQGLTEAGGKIACLKCDGVSTAKAWQKRGNTCPKCKKSSQGVAEESNMMVKEAIPSTGKEINIAIKGKLVKKLKLPANARAHHIAQELRGVKLGLSDFELQDAARKLANGQTFKSGTLVMQAGNTRPREMESVQEDAQEFAVGDTVIALKGPHKGDKHEVIHCFGDGTCNVRPLTHRVRYRMGAAKANFTDLKAAE